MVAVPSGERAKALPPLFLYSPIYGELDWTTHTPDGQIDTTINFGSGRLHALLALMRAHDLLDEGTPQPPFPPNDAPPDAWEALHTLVSPDPLRILAFKLRDQNGWTISAAECSILAHRLRGCAMDTCRCWSSLPPRRWQKEAFA